MHIWTFYISNALLWAFVSDVMQSMQYRVPELVLEIGQIPEKMKIFSGVREGVTHGMESVLKKASGGTFPLVRVQSADGTMLGYEKQRHVRARFPGLNAADLLTFEPV